MHINILKLISIQNILQFSLTHVTNYTYVLNDEFMWLVLCMYRKVLMFLQFYCIIFNVASLSILSPLGWPNVWPKFAGGLSVYKIILIQLRALVVTTVINQSINHPKYLSVFQISNFRRNLNIVYILLGISPASNCSWPTFRNPVSLPSSKAGCRQQTVIHYQNNLHNLLIVKLGVWKRELRFVSRCRECVPYLLLHCTRYILLVLSVTLIKETEPSL